MTFKIKLADLIDSIEFNSEAGQAYLHLKTGDIYFITEKTINIASEEDQNLPDWQEAEIKIAKQYLENPDEFLLLPTQYDVNEYQMMETFVENLENIKIADQLWIALGGPGAFRRFKDSVILWGLDKEWYQFRDEEYKKFAIEWCQENNLEFK